MWNLCVNLAVVVVVVKKKQFIPWSVDIAAADICPFRKESHGSSIHPDLNMSEFSKLAIGKSCLGKVVRFFYSFTLRRMGRPAPFYEGYLFCFFFGGEEISKKQLPSSLHYRSSQAFVEKMFVFLWKVKALTPVAQILVPRQSSIF